MESGEVALKVFPWKSFLNSNLKNKFLNIKRIILKENKETKNWWQKVDILRFDIFRVGKVISVDSKILKVGILGDPSVSVTGTDSNYRHKLL